MTEGEARKIVLAELNNVAPESDAGKIDPQADLREALDIDSLDFLNFITALHKVHGIIVPESDYPKLLTVTGAVAYIAQRKP
ncbi:MAG: acyl carrier protein [Alphaproteobacteria bacterium]|nr:acyl carrier protein [Alphaproteobacteria bacterium]